MIRRFLCEVDYSGGYVSCLNNKNINAISNGREVGKRDEVATYETEKFCGEWIKKGFYPRNYCSSKHGM